MTAILFDLDGTLIDHFSAIHRAINHSQRALGLPESDYATVRASVGGSVPKTMAKLMPGREIEDALPLFREHFGAIMLEDVELLPGARWILASLKERGHRCAVFTNHFADNSETPLSHLGVRPLLDAVIGTGNSLLRKPDPAFTQVALEQMQTSPEDTILVGDSPYDADAAGTHGLPCYLVTTGSHDRTQLEAETKADGIFPDLYALGTTVFGLELESPAKG